MLFVSVLLEDKPSEINDALSITELLRILRIIEQYFKRSCRATVLDHDKRFCLWITARKDNANLNFLAANINNIAMRAFSVTFELERYSRITDAQVLHPECV